MLVEVLRDSRELVIFDEAQRIFGTKRQQKETLGVYHKSWQEVVKKLARVNHAGFTCNVEDINEQF